MIKQNGEIKDTTQTKNKKYSSHQMGVFAFNGSNASILMRDTSLGNIWDGNLTWENAIESGPLLLMQGKRMPLAENAFNQNRHPRTCVCITKDEILLLTADGRSNEAYGLSLFELTELLESIGCTEALNFDGGGSTTMYIKDASSSGIINMPCDNKTFDHEGERKVSNALLINVIRR
jgi:exopolysaccharide biosynthesis protein